MSIRRVFALVLVSWFATSSLGCDDKSKSKSEDDDKGSKKKKKSSDDDDDEDKKKEPAGVEVPGTKDFLVPPGGTYKHNSFEIGDKTLVLESYDYPVADFPRPALRKSVALYAKKAGWKLDADHATASTIKARKGGKMLSILVGEADEKTTKLNVAPPLPDDGMGESEGEPGDVEDFTGDYNSTDGAATITQKGTKISIKYAIGSATCTAAGKTLSCAWTEANGSGKATITKRPDGQILGTWGRGVSATNGGEWRFIPKKKK